MSRSMKLGGVGGRGSVIVVILVALALASLLLARFVETTSVELLVATREADRDRLRGDAAGAMELALAVLAEVRAIDGGRVHGPAQGWGDPHEYAMMEPREGVEVTVAYEDESGKLSLPRMDAATLKEVGVGLGLMDRDAERLADAILTWIRPEHTPVSFDVSPTAYEREALPHRPPGRSLRTRGEMAAVAVARDYFYDEEGRETALAAGFWRVVSRYDFGVTNLNAASPELLAMRGLDTRQIELVQGWQGGMVARPVGAMPYFRTLDEARGLMGESPGLAGFGTEVQALWVTVTVREGRAVMRLRALVAFDQGVRLPAAAALPEGVERPAAPAEVEERLDYPVRILELNEDNGSSVDFL